MKKETLGRGLQLINAILSTNSQIKDKSTLDSYYLLLEDLPDKEFLEGVTNLMKKWDNPHFIPGPGAIRKEVENIIFSGLSKEEFLLVAKTYKITKLKYSNQKLNNILARLDLSEITEDRIVFLEDNCLKKLT